MPAFPAPATALLPLEPPVDMLPPVDVLPPVDMLPPVDVLPPVDALPPFTVDPPLPAALGPPPPIVPCVPLQALASAMAHSSGEIWRRDLGSRSMSGYRCIRRTVMAVGVTFGWEWTDAASDVAW
jgi:hypothetical protein